MSVLALPLIPLIGAVTLLASHARPRLLGPLAVLALLATLAVALWAAVAEPEASWAWSPELALHLAVSDFSRVMVALVPAIAAPIVAYAAATEHEGRARLVALLLAFVGAMLLLVTAADFLTLLIAWELIGVASWALIGHDWRDAENPRQAARAFLTTRIGDLGLYLAAGVAFAASGGITFDALGDVDGRALDAVAAGVLLAAVAKSAQLPFSPWLFSAMAGPTPVSALLHSATLVAAGAYLLIRLAPALEPVGWFLPAVTAVGLATALVGGVVASLQTHVKRVLAASTAAQYGLMFVAVGASSTVAAGAHLVTHAAFKSLLFLGAGIAIHTAATNRLAGMRLGRVLPRAAVLSAVGALALAAVPPLGAAWSKEQVIAAAVHASPWVGLGAFAAALLSAFYATRYQLLVYGPAEDGGEGGARHVSGAELASLAVLATLTPLLSALWLPGASAVVEDLVAGALVASAPWELLVALALIALAVCTAWWLWQQGRLDTLGMSPRAQVAAGDWLGLPAATTLLIERPIWWTSQQLAQLDDRVVDAGVQGVAALVRSVSRLLGRFDDHVVDAGVRGVAAFARGLSRLSSVRGEWTIDGAVRAIAETTMRAASGSRITDDRAIDAAVEQGARGIGAAGTSSRRLQTGMSHHYYLVAAGGFAAIVAVLALFRW